MHLLLPSITCDAVRVGAVPRSVRFESEKPSVRSIFHCALIEKDVGDDVRISSRVFQTRPNIQRESHVLELLIRNTRRRFFGTMPLAFDMISSAATGGGVGLNPGGNPSTVGHCDELAASAGVSFLPVFQGKGPGGYRIGPTIGIPPVLVALSSCPIDLFSACISFTRTSRVFTS